MSAHKFQKLLLHIVAVVTLLVLLTLSLPTASSQSAPFATPGDLEIQNLQITANPSVNESVVVSFRLQNNTSQDITIGRMGVGIRGPNACAYENPWSTPDSVDPGGWNDATVRAGQWADFSVRFSFPHPGVYILEPVYVSGNNDNPFPPFKNSRPIWPEVRDSDGNIVAQDCLLEVVKALTVTPSSGQPGDQFTASFTVRNNGSHNVVLYDLKAAGRRGADWDSPNADFPGLGYNIRIEPGQAFAYSKKATRNIEGNYFAEPWFDHAGYDAYPGPMPAFLGQTNGSNRATYNVSQASPTTYSIMGRVFDGNTGHAIDGIQVCVDASHCATTGGIDHWYWIEYLVAGIYIVTPYSNDYTFDPAYRDVTLPMPPDQPVDFTAIPKTLATNTPTTVPPTFTPTTAPPTLTPTPPPSTNDDFDYADLIPEPPANGLATQILETDTTDATVAPDDPDMGCGTGTNSNTLWYKLVPSYYGLVQVRTYSTLDPANASSDYDTVVAVFTGQRGALSRIACNDDAPDHGALSDLTFEAEAGQTYYIEVADYGSSAGGGMLSLFVNYQISPKAWTLMFYMAGDNDANQEHRLFKQYTLLSEAKINLHTNVGSTEKRVTPRKHHSIWGDFESKIGSK